MSAAMSEQQKLQPKTNAKSLPRLSVCRMNDNGMWDDYGTGRVVVDYLEGSEVLCIFVIGEEENDTLLLHPIRQENTYQMHQDRIISWIDPKDSTLLALFFEETEGFSYVWNRIHDVQSKQESGIASPTRGGSRQKVTLERIIIIINFILELPSAAFDQLSSVHKPHYALMAVLMSYAALFMCIIDLVYKGRKERVTWMRKGKIPWLYHSSPSNKPFGSFPDIVGISCVVCQSIVTTINYAFLCQHSNIPIKFTVWPIMFSFGLLCSEFIRNPSKIEKGEGIGGQEESIALTNQANQVQMA